MKLLRSMLHGSSSRSSLGKRSFLAVRAFTLVELMVTVSIFVFMTTLVISKYGNFNQNVLLTNLAYDMALTFRTAQTFGVSVKAADDINNPCNQAGANPFQCVYGIHFSSSVNTTFTLYAMPITSLKTYYTYPALTGPTGSSADIYTYTLRNGAHIDRITDQSRTHSIGSTYPTVDVYFKRPDSSSHICMVDADGVNPQCDAAAGITSVRVKIVSDSNPDNYRTVVVYRNGQITIEN